ncbi:unnamed protein product, partial [Tetraodon nigroviridis]
FVLPTTDGKHQDLKYITSETMVAAVLERFHHLVERIIIIDCRYPYEFEGGHIKVGGAPRGSGWEPRPSASALSGSLFLFPSPPGSPEPAPGGPRGGLPPPLPHHPVLLRQARGHHLPLRVLLGARPAHVPLRARARPRHERVPPAALPRALHPEGRIQGVLPRLQGDGTFPRAYPADAPRGLQGGPEEVPLQEPHLGGRAQQHERPTTG